MPKITKTTATSYTIETDEGSFLATPEGTKWICSGKKFPSLKAVKAAIEKGVLSAEVGEEEETEEYFEGIEPYLQSHNPCPNPAALLALTVCRRDKDPPRSSDLPETIRAALDVYAFIDPETGRVDRKSARREVTRWKSLKGKRNGNAKS